ncbi:hypothetical protein TNCV_319831 [Trichonephila clavipes]|nr:hypothetical protein TNCV_319831 [Trichonephila clavipes]
MRLEELARVEKVILAVLELKEKELQMCVKFDSEILNVDQLKKRANANMKVHCLDNYVNLESATQIAGLYDNYENISKVNSKPTDSFQKREKFDNLRV